MGGITQAVFKLLLLFAPTTAAAREMQRRRGVDEIRSMVKGLHSRLEAPSAL
jgi:hypothetical protein